MGLPRTGTSLPPSPGRLSPPLLEKRGLPRAPQEPCPTSVTQESLWCRYCVTGGQCRGLASLSGWVVTSGRTETWGVVRSLPKREKLQQPVRTQDTCGGEGRGPGRGPLGMGSGCSAMTGATGEAAGWEWGSSRQAHGLWLQHPGGPAHVPCIP